ncbi:MAG: hypothetical protein K8I00_10585, partial [Candidatus Omnitrophica bacterium]|nr:hypothetical protein [Candidatus Omnitrophota bacterium]
SQRHLARSRKATDPLQASVIRQRSKLLRDLSRRQRAAYHHSLIGTTQHVLFEQKKEGYVTGLTDNYVRIHARTNRNVLNNLCKLRVNGVDAERVYGIIEEI